MAPAPVRSHLEGDINAPEYPRDFPIIVHTLVDRLVHIDLYPVNNFDRAKLPYSESHSLRWLHVSANNMQWVEVRKASVGFCGSRPLRARLVITP